MFLFLYFLEAESDGKLVVMGYCCTAVLLAMKNLSQLPLLCVS